MQEYEAEKLAIGIKTARLRALRLAKEAESNERTKRKAQNLKMGRRRPAATRRLAAYLVDFCNVVVPRRCRSMIAPRLSWPTM
jgi:hypothetical protein